MRSTYRNQSNYRSTAFGLITVLLAVLLLAAPAAAGNTAVYEAAENASSYSADISFTNLDKFYLVSPGFFFGLGGDEALAGISDLTLTDVSTGEVITPEEVKGTLTFPKGDYTLSYTAPINDGEIYLKYPEKFDVTVIIHDPYTTGHMVLGPVGEKGIVTKTDLQTTVTYTGIEKTSLRIYDKNREFILYGFFGVWAVIVLILFLRHRSIKKKQMKLDE